MEVPTGQNPFKNDDERAQIWDMLVERDINAFIAADWSMVADDFIEAGFLGIDARKDSNPDKWVAAFPTLNTYRDEWLRQAQVSAKTQFAEPLAAAIHRASSLTQIDIEGRMAVAHKKFDGQIKLADGTVDTLNWQTLYYCRKVGGQWKIAGFTGYMAHK